MINGSDYSSVDKERNCGRRMKLWTVNWMDIVGRRMTRPSLSSFFTFSHLVAPQLTVFVLFKWTEMKRRKCECLKIEMPSTRHGSKNESIVWRTWARIEAIDTWCCCSILQQMNNHVRHYHDEELVVDKVIDQLNENRMSINRSYWVNKMNDKFDWFNHLWIDTKKRNLENVERNPWKNIRSLELTSRMWITHHDVDAD